MNTLTQIRKFLNEDRAYALMAVFVILFFAYAQYAGPIRNSISNEARSAAKASRPAGAEVEKLMRLDEEKLKEALSEKAPLNLVLAALSLLFLAGVILFFVFAYHFLCKGWALLPQRRPWAVSWDAWDVVRVCILFLFCSAALILAQACAGGMLFKAVRDDNFRMILNATIGDLVAFAGVIYFACLKYPLGDSPLGYSKKAVSSLGISFENFFKNVFTGIAGYLAVLPLLVGALILVSFLARVVNYAPKPEPIVVIFFKEERARLLVYFAFFIAVIGPIIEEVFFRGFLYPVLRKKAGVPKAVFSSAVLFGLLHTNVIGLLPITILGALLAYLYERTGSLVSSITVHILHNFALVGLIFLLRAVV